MSERRGNVQSLLFLQKLGVEPRVIEDLIREIGLPFAATWDDWRHVKRPQDVFALVTVQAVVDDRILERFPNVRMIAVAFTGYDSLDLEACRRRGVAVYNVPGYSTDSVAELTLALTICLLRNIPSCEHTLRAGGWRPDRRGTELAGKVVGIIGTGAIGLRVAELFRAFKCTLTGWSRTERKEFGGLGGTYLSKERVIAGADVLSLHLPLTPDTEGIIGESELALMKPGACLINTARGRLVDQSALTRALQKGRIRAALDVFDREPLPAGDPLTQTDNSLLTPHIAFQTGEALYRRARITVQNLRSFLEGSGRNRVA